MCWMESAELLRSHTGTERRKLSRRPHAFFLDPHFSSAFSPLSKARSIHPHHTHLMTSLAGLARVVIEFSPASPASRAAREFWARISCSRTRAAFPDCAVEAVRLPDPAAPPRVLVQVGEAGGAKKVAGSATLPTETLEVAGLTAAQVAARVAALGAGGAAGGPAAAVTGKGGGAPPGLASGWGAGDASAGVSAKVPVG